MASFRIPERNLAQLQARIARLAKRAVRLGFVGPDLTVRQAEQIHLKDEDGFPYVRTFYPVELSGIDVVKLNGWSLAAVLDAQFTEEGIFAGNILRVVPGGPVIDVKYREAASFCDHCKTARRRNQTMLVVNEAGEWKQVGSDCIKDFLGHASAEKYAELAQIIIDARDLAEAAEDDYGPGGSRVASKWPADYILQLASSAIRQYGWRSRATAENYGGQSTSGLVNAWLFEKSQDRKKWEHALDISEADEKQAAEVCEWLAALSTRRDLTDYMYNLSLLGRVQAATTKHLGMLCAAVSTFAKEKEREINRRKKFEDELSSVYVGTVGTRQLFSNLTLAFTTTFESDYGPIQFYKFKDEAGNVIVWKSSSIFFNVPMRRDIEQGDVVTIEAMVKAHEERKGVKQTKINRAKFPPREMSKDEKKALKLARRCANRLKFDDYETYTIFQKIVTQIEDGE